MTTRQLLEDLLTDLPEERLQEIVGFAQFVRWRDDQQEWQDFGRRQFASAYGDNEPEYGLGDLSAHIAPPP